MGGGVLVSTELSHEPVNSRRRDGVPSSASQPSMVLDAFVDDVVVSIEGLVQGRPRFATALIKQ